MQTTGALLIIDDDADVLKAAAMALSREAPAVDVAATPEGLETKVGAGAYDAILLDMNFVPGARDGAAGLDWLARFQAAEALKRGAVDFVLKPWRNEALIAALASAAALTRQRRATGAQLNLDDLERRAIERALDLHDGNISHAAAALGLTRPALYRRMARHGL